MWPGVAVAALLVGAFAGWLAGRRLVRPGATEMVVPPAPRPGSEMPFADLVEEHADGVVIVDRSGHIAYRNRVLRGLQGSHLGVVLDQAIERFAEEFPGDTTQIVEVYGPPKSVYALAGRALDDGRTAVYLDDITERRRMDQIRTDFVANISHELKTPIGALAVLAETLEGETDPELIERVVVRMRLEADRAAHTVDDLMELSRIELGGDHIAEPVPVADVIRAAVDRVRQLADQRSIGITTLDPLDRDGHRAGAIVVEGDRRQLASAIGNLVENAVKYSDQGGTVQIRARQDGAAVEITVADQGVGIPQRDLDRIFERFYRVDRGRSRATGGTGLGLSIVRHVVANHGGEISVSSTEGAGSTFVVRLPVRHAEPASGDAVPTDTEPTEETA